MFFSGNVVTPHKKNLKTLERQAFSGVPLVEILFPLQKLVVDSLCNIDGSSILKLEINSFYLLW